jgi:uncharacterized membrane protein YfcA
MEILSTWTIFNLVLVFTGAFILGLAKAGLRGIDMLNVTLMALVFGGKLSTGIVLPLLCIADIGAVLYYHRHAQWKHFWKLLPWMAVGILIGVYAGKDMNEVVFRKIMSIIIILTVIIMGLMEIIKSENVPTHPFFAASTGIMAGITTMLGNLAGAFSNLYFLAMRLPKNHFIGTSAWLFLVINLFKLPFQVLFWKNITISSLQTDLLLIPALALGFFIGIKIVKQIQEHYYRKVVIILTLIGAVVIFLKH